MPSRRPFREMAEDHVAELERELYARVAYTVGPVEPGVANARAYHRDRRIETPSIRTRRDYFVVLHEFGHFAEPPTGETLYDEATAWTWALDNAIFEPTMAVYDEILGSLYGYAVGRLRFRSFDDAVAAVPEGRRPAVEAIVERVHAGRAVLASA